ncbi:MAG: hypothetical protein AB7O62_10755 [Pirellulales bacterium]
MMGVLGAVFAIALALGALRANSEVIAALALAIYVGLLCFSLVGALVCNDQRRVFWVGFAVFGWVYAIGVIWSEPATSVGNRLAVRSVLPTTRALEWLSSMQSTYSVGSKVVAQWRGGGWYTATITAYDAEAGLYNVQWDDGSAAEWVNIHQMQYGGGAGVRGGHAILGPLVGALGGLISCWSFCTRDVAVKVAAG